MTTAEQQTSESIDQLITWGAYFQDTLTPNQLVEVKLYSLMYARSVLERVAMEEHREGRHTLAKGLLKKALSLGNVAGV